MKVILVFAVMLVSIAKQSFAQGINWQAKDLEKDGVFGVSANKAYSDLLKNKKAKTVIVGILDAGLDTLHEDLKAVLWSDPKTGHHGWNYIGNETGREDLVNLTIQKDSAFYDSLSLGTVPQEYRKGYQAYRQSKKLKLELNEKINNLKDQVSVLEKENNPENAKLISLVNYHLAHGLNAANNEADTASGNADVYPDKILPWPSTDPGHGTHVAGIIGAVRGNGIGLNGIADHVQIMMVKTNGNLREIRDKAIANGIRYAVDHGAKVINMSFGKPYTWDKTAVDDAIKYAMSKDVLFIHAAGNTSSNLDNSVVYPTATYDDGKDKADAFIVVGASGPKDDQTLAVDFSNYGQKTVDVFAPGVDIYSTYPGNEYKTFSGTSMAAPIVAGIAALIREYYPKLTAVQVKDIIMKSVVKRDVLKDKCVSGGVVNAYNALKLAATYK
ncbi:subtilase family protein [Mucilaginibacter gracilis]|uniref:Subtilase family protein n=1 Tax=Mucilaginibacter gracilis TaxID=423350 RepID=A0A495ITU3_9SPHI|nr:S8 family serine peptidase [Mucilaginibacter gracilis]RKR79992.1 subtilase family protein [Mucilaginibacter gracilis]